jgi:P4 family phage/plasmid primase-like protien
LDRNRYKGQLLPYLHAKGIEAKIGINRCFSPSHNDSSPSCQIWEDNFFCHGCGIQGDIYDAIGILEGIPEFKDQYIFAEKMFDGGPAFSPAVADPKKETKKREPYTPDKDAESKLEAFLDKNTASEKAIRQYLKNRALANSSGKIPDYPADILPELVKHFFYWPGIEEARRALDSALLKAVRIANPKDGKTSWFHSGVVAKLGKGYKLFYIHEGQSEKRGTYECHTFPMPGTVDPAAPVVLVEGEIDALACSSIGIKNVFSTGGTTALTKPAIETYLLNVPEIILCFDADNKGRYFAGIDPYLIHKDKETGEEKHETPATIPEKIIKTGYKGKIKIAILPPVEESGYKDPDAYIVDGKKDLVLKAIAEANEYTPPELENKDPILSWEAYDTITIKRLKSLLNKINRADMNTEDIKPFVSACLKACNHDSTRLELAKWGASVEELDNKDDKTSPYFLIEICETYEVSKYIRNEIEKALIPAAEMLKRIKVQPTIIDIDFNKMEKNQNALQFLKTKGVHSAALMVADILDGRMAYNDSDKRYYFFDGHVWQREPDMANIIYDLLCAVMRYFLERSNKGNKGVLYDILTKIEGRRFRVEASQDFSGLSGVFHGTILFDGPTVRETLTLADGVLDFSGSEIVYRKSKREEYRKEMLPYKINDIKNAGIPEQFLNFMKGNFKDEKTLESLMYYISLFPSRNTQYKYGGIWVGKPHTGKTTMIELLGKVFDGMFVRLNADILVTRNHRRASGNEATPYIARLEGKGLGIAQETERNGVLNNALWKELTGGDTLTARGLYKDPHDFTPTAQILVSTNHQPRFDAHDAAAIERMVVIPFSIQHEKGKKGTLQQNTIYSRLRPEYPAIVKLFAEYYIRLKNEHEGVIPLSDECSNYKNNYVKEQETILDTFVNDCIDIDMSGDAFEIVQNVYERYLKYYDLSVDDKDTLTRNKFVRYLRNDYMEINYKQKKIKGEPVLCFFNIRLKPDIGQTDMSPLPWENDRVVKNNNNSRDGSGNPPPEEIPF